MRAPRFEPQLAAKRHTTRPDTKGGARLAPPAYGVEFVDRPSGVQQHRADGGQPSEARIHAAARLGTSGGAGRLPHSSAIQRSFGRHDVSTIAAHTDARAASGASAMGAIGFAHGEHVAFSRSPDLRLAAHEAAHVIQQRAGVRLAGGGVGRVGDAHEQLADAVADRVGAGRSAEDLLDRVSGSSTGPASSPTPAVQRYAVLGPDKVYGAMPAKRPWFGYPYAVADGGTLISQTHRVGVTGNHDFLDADDSNTAWTRPAGNAFSLRVSNTNEMAVEDSDLTDRQPKVFFATQAVIDASNQALLAAHSNFSLVANATTVTILTGWHDHKTLVQATPRFNGGSADLAPQNCNAMAAQVMGWNSGWTDVDGKSAAALAVKRLAPRAAAAYKRAYDDETVRQPELDRLTNEMAREYVGNRNSPEAARLHANRHAAPSVGQTYMIASMGTGPDVGGGRSRLHDYETNTDRDVGWPYHFGGVVAHSGADRITLENFARGDNRQDARDPRWYFQMYGSFNGQSFHDFHKAKLDYANPITVELAKPA